MARERFDQVAYWNRVAERKTFAHPLPTGWLARIERAAPVLDLGCGYGRALRELEALGFTGAIGVDTAAAMIARGRRESPGLDLRHHAGGPLPFEAARFGAVLLLAVLTCLPDDGEQRALLDEARRVLAPGGLLVISDLPLQDGERERARYARGLEEHGTYGVFSLPDGAVVRHHDAARWAEFEQGFEALEQRHLDAVTMNGHPCRIVQVLLRRPR